MSKRALVAMLAALAIALAAGVVATAKQSGDHSPGFARQLASARLATAKYATDLDQAKADGYQIITRDIPNMGWHFMNPKIQDFDVRRPPILVYEKTGRRRGSSQRSSGSSPRSPPSRRSRAPATARSRRPATTPTGPSCPRRRRIAVRRRPPTPAPPSPSGTRTS
jgi:hypothetical protein